MMAANGSDDGKLPAEGPLPVDKVQDLVRDIKAHADSLGDDEAHAQELKDHADKVEAALATEEPEHGMIATLLDEFRTLSAEATEALRTSGAMTLLNEILGTGVPPT